MMRFFTAEHSKSAKWNHLSLQVIKRTLHIKPRRGEMLIECIKNAYFERRRCDIKTVLQINIFIFNRF